MGKAILRGLLRKGETSALGKWRFEASVPNDVSAQQLQQDFRSFADRVRIRTNDNLQLAQNADIILLSFPPHQLESVFSEKGMGDAIADKLVISMLAGIGRADIEDQLSKSTRNPACSNKWQRHIVRVMPSIGILACESATLVAVDDPSLPAQSMQLAREVFNQIGQTYTTPGHLFDSTMALMAVVHGLMSIAVDAFVDGGAVVGIPRDQALGVVGQCMRGYSSLVVRGDDPAELKKPLMVPRGFTAQAILNLERRGVRSAISDVVLESAASATRPDQG
jgi:pyrroline-5-carboxylate reductase